VSFFEAKRNISCLDKTRACTTCCGSFEEATLHIVGGLAEKTNKKSPGFRALITLFDKLLQARKKDFRASV